MTARAPRFPIQAPLRYRASGDPAWHKGATVNLSRSGVLFSSENEIEPATMMELCIVFPPEITGGVAANVVCMGPVVRRDGLMLAVAILKYCFARE